MLFIENARIITGEPGEVITGGRILIEGNLIAAVGADLARPAAAQVINADNMYVVPGFIDGHTHIGLEEEIYGEAGDDVNEYSDPFTPQLRASDGINLWDMAFTDALKGGVTREISLPGSANVLGGQAVFLKNYAPNKEGMIFRDCCGLKAALGENPKRVYKSQKKAPYTRMGSADLLRKSFYIAAKLLEKDEITPEQEYIYQPLLAILKKEIPLLLHAHRADDLLTALRIKDEFGFNLIIQHGTEAHLIADELKRRQVPIFLGPMLVNRAKVEMKEVAFKTAARLYQAGVKFAFITDHPVIPVEHARIHAGLAARAGLEYSAALAALTKWPAEILGVSDQLGTITAGKIADISIFNGDPLSIDAQVSQVIVEGRVWNNPDYI